jgi:hypothetical protein
MLYLNLHSCNAPYLPVIYSSYAQPSGRHGGRRRAENSSCAIVDGAPISASTIGSNRLQSSGGDAGSIAKALRSAGRRPYASRRGYALADAIQGRLGHRSEPSLRIPGIIISLIFNEQRKLVLRAAPLKN